MSLLMDALKRAEEEKKRLSGEVGSPESTATDGLLAASSGGRNTGAGDDSSEDPTLEASHQPTAEFSLEPMEGETTGGVGEATGPEPTLNTSQLSATAPSRAREADQELLRGEEGAGLSGALAPNAAREWDSTRPSQRPREGAGKPNLDATQAGVRTRKPDYDFGDISTRVAADTVFAAGRQARGGSLLRVGGLALASVLAALAGIGLYLELNIPGPVALAPQTIGSTGKEPAPVPTIKLTDNHQQQPPAAVMQSGTAATMQATSVAASAPAPTMGLPPTRTPLPTLAPAAAEGSRLARVDTGPVVPSMSSTETNAPEMPEATPTPKPSRSALVTRDVVPTAEPFYRTDVGQFHIARGKNVASLSALLEEGYSAFRIGSFARAEYLYQSALTQAPESRDALLGLAAINLQRGANDRAYRYYRQVLDLYPKDSVATAALLSLGTNEPQELNEARLQELKSGQVRSPEVQFSLGNAMAKRERWSEAQQAYFDAYTQDDRNPDYAFNLAVSLDRLGQGKAALGYYRKAVDLARVRPGQFDMSRTLARAEALRQVVGEN